MKKFTRTMALLLIGGSTLLTSCVSEDISPEVENLRQAQVNYLNSKAAMEQAKAENEAAITARIQAETALIQLQVDLNQAVMQAEVDAKIADMEAQVANALADVAAAHQRAAAAEVALQASLDALAAQVNETAQSYLTMYRTTTDDANNKLNDIADLEGDIARFKAYLDENGAPFGLDQLAETFSLDIAQSEAEIATLEANITRIEGVNLNTAEVEAELALVKDELAQKQADFAALNLEYSIANDNYDKLDRAYNGWNNLGAKDLSEGIAVSEGSVADLEGQISIHEAKVASLEAQLAPFEAELDMTGEGVPAAIDDAMALLEVWIQAEAELSAADINHDAGDAEYDEAVEAVDEAKAAFIEYAGDYEAIGYGDPNTTSDMFSYGYYAPIVGTTFGDILIPHYRVINDSNYETLKNDYANALEILNSDQNMLEATNLWISTSQTRLAEILAANNATTVEELKTALDKASTASSELFYQNNVKDSEVVSLLDLMGSLQNYIDDTSYTFATAIENWQGQIEMLNDNISANEAALADNVISQEEWDAKIVREEQRLEGLTKEYNALVALANDYLDRFNEAMED